MLKKQRSHVNDLLSDVDDLLTTDKTEAGKRMLLAQRGAPKNKQLLKKDGLHTGDLGKLDKEGNLFYLGRLKDSVRVKGENISAWEIETNLNNHNEISESAILSVKAEVGEDDMAVLLVSKKKNKTNLNDLIREVAKNLPKNYLPRYWSYVNDLSRTPSLRIDKKLIKIETLTFYDFLKNKFTVLNRN